MITDKDKMMREKALDNIMSEAGESEYEKKIKPLLTITIAAGEPQEEMMEEEMEGMDPGLAKILKSK